MDLEIIVKNDPAALATLGRDAITTHIANLYDLLYFHSGNRVINAGLLSKLFGFSSHYKKMEEASRTVNTVTSATQQSLGEDMNSTNFGKNYLSQGFMRGQVDLVFTLDNVLRSTTSFHKLAPEMQTIESKFNINNISMQIEKYLAAEREHIMIVSPYLWLEPRQIQKLKVWLGRDPKRKMTIITNSIMTSDNMLAQTLVDAVLGPQLILDRTYVDPADNKTYSYNENQIKIYEYGRLDSIDLGGNKPYGKLHAKGASLQSQNGSFVTTWNGDPRSQYLNSETGLVAFSREYSEKIHPQFAEWIRNSHEWGSEEYHAIRKHEKLGATKRQIGKHVQSIFKLIVSLKLDWLI